ncbi:hypothetical protein H7142_01640 [Candidatus Saccharibacteria bacterium]|nr:hypothetical protein [Candidatus Saccharibacteria bacterium]
MINLLPYDHKQEIKAGRTNVLLVRYIGILVVAAAVLGGLVVGSYYTINTTKTDAESKVAENQSRAQEYEPVKAQADSFRTDLATAKNILDNKVSFSKLIYKIADTVPRNVILGDLTLDPKTFGSSVTMTASAKSFDDAAKLKDSFIKNDQIFSNVKLQTIQSGVTTGEQYPVKVSLSVVINKGALQ